MNISVPQRTCGVKPKDPEARTEAVKQAVRTLEKIGAAFSIADVAERAGISRATIYRSTKLRAIIGAKGDGARTVDAKLHETLTERHEASKVRARKLRRQLMELEQSWDEMRERATSAERKLAEMQRRVEMLESQVRQRGVGTSALTGIASQMTTGERRQARRQLARALHPDLFAQDEAVQAIATELLKLVNSLAE